MGSIVSAAWIVVLKRSRSDWLVLSAAVLTILLATTLLAAGPIYAAAVSLSGLHRTLADAPVTEANVRISTQVPPDQFRAIDELVQTTAAERFAPTGGQISRTGRSESFELPNQRDPALIELAVFGMYQQLEQHAALIDGGWPGDGATAIETAIPEPVALELGLAPGDTMRLTSRRNTDFQADVLITGIYRINSAADPYWWNQPLDIEGTETGGSFKTYGPFVVTPNTLFGRLSPASSQVNWRIYPEFPNLTVAETSLLRRNVEGLEFQLNLNRPPSEQIQVQTELDNILERAERSLLVTRSGILVLTLQLAILAGYALVLTSGLLVDQRRVETELLRSRGAATGQIAALTLMEALILALPAALAGPWLAALSLRALNHIGPLAAIDLDLDPIVGSDAYALAAGAALGCIAVFALPAFLSARSYAQVRAGKNRQGTRSVAQRAGIDLALLVGAALAYWQLRRYGAPLTETVQGRLGIDPFLIAAPAVGLLAGAIAALRIVPLLARLFDRLAQRSRRLVPSLGAWQVARRPLRYARSALLLILACAIGLFALTYARTWTLSQQDQADYQVGADLYLRSDRRPGTSIPPYNLAQAHNALDGVVATMPIRRESMFVSRSAGEARILALDASTAAEIVRFRSDLASQPLDQLLAELESRRPELSAIALPGSPQHLAVELALTIDPLPEGTRVPQSGAGLAPSATVVVRDARGMLYRLLSNQPLGDGAITRLEFPLVAERDQLTARPEYPLSLVAVEFRLVPLSGIVRSGEFSVVSIQTSDSPDGRGWQGVHSTGPPNWTLQQTGLIEAPTFTPIETDGSRIGGIRFSSGSTARPTAFPITFSLRAPGPAISDVIPALVSERYLTTTEARVGDEVSVELGGARRPMLIVGSVAAFPTLDPLNSSIIVVDLATLAALKFQSYDAIQDPEEWWLAVEPGRREEVARQLSATPYSSVEVVDRMERGRALRTDPVALGTIGALSLGFVAAALFAAVGFAVSAAVSARERLTEFALLRAIGLSPGQLSGWLTIENGFLIALSLVGGTGLGLALAWLILPLVSLTQAAERTVPDVIVVIPWQSVLWLEIAILLALALAVGALAVALRRVGLGSALRLGEE